MLGAREIRQPLTYNEHGLHYLLHTELLKAILDLDLNGKLLLAGV